MSKPTGPFSDSFLKAREETSWSLRRGFRHHCLKLFTQTCRLKDTIEYPNRFGYTKKFCLRKEIAARHSGAYARNLSTWECEARRSILSQLGLSHPGILFLKGKKRSREQENRKRREEEDKGRKGREEKVRNCFH